MKVLMMTDLEGVAGVEEFRSQSYPDGKYHDQAKRLLTAEVNAAVEGLLEAGAEDVIVIDGHGPGGIWFEDLHPSARLIHGRPIILKNVFEELGAQSDVAMIIGQHAMAGVALGNQNHTQSSRAIDYIMLNGQKIGEIAQFGLYMGAFDVPLVFLSGDEAACQEAQALIPGISTVAVKRGLGRNAALTLSAPEARRQIREGALEAIRKHAESPLKPLVWEGPYTLEKRYFHTDVADGAANSKDAERLDGQTIRFQDTDIKSIIYR